MYISFEATVVWCYVLVSTQKANKNKEGAEIGWKQKRTELAYICVTHLASQHVEHCSQQGQEAGTLQYTSSLSLDTGNE